MKFIVDECIGPSVARWLIKHGHDVVSIYDDFAGISDHMVLKKSIEENRMLITSDKDFGEIIFKNKHKHVGVLFLRLLDERPLNKIFILDKVLQNYSNELHENFIVVTDINIRIVKS